MDNPGKENYFKNKSTEELNKMLKVLLCGDNGGGMLADDIILELKKRFDAINQH